MTDYEINPMEGVIEAFFVINPEAEITDLVQWCSDEDRSFDDPRLELYSRANLCEVALGQLTDKIEGWVDPLVVAKVAGALMHYQTAIRAFNAIIGHPRLKRLSEMSPLEALKACIPNSMKAIT